MTNAEKFLEELKKKKKNGIMVQMLEDKIEQENGIPRDKIVGGDAYTSAFLAALDTQKVRTPITYDDIAPVKPTVGSVSGTKSGGGGGSFTVKSEEDDSLLDFFQKPKGWNDSDSIAKKILNVGRAALNTAEDAVLNVNDGFDSMAEGISDFVVHGIADVADFFGADYAASKMREQANINAVEEKRKQREKFFKTDEFSVLGRTSDAATQGAGQMAAMLLSGQAAASLGTAAATAATTGATFASSFGQERSNAYNEGATDEESRTSALIAGAADAVTELLSGGLGKGVKAVGLSHGLGGFDDIIAKKATEKIKNTIAKNVVEYGIKASGEGLEEVLAGAIQAWGKSITYMDERDYMDILEDENLLEQFVVGGLISGGAQMPGLVKSNKSGTDFVTGRTKNEQAVIDRVVENEVKKAEADGKKLKPKERQAIEEQAAADMERGRIEIDTIEEVLGGDEYKAYQDAVKEEDALRKEYEELGELKEPTLAQRTRYEELHEKASEFSSDERRTALKTKVSERVAEMAKSDRLSESYAERYRRGEYFTEDVEKYKSDAAKKTVQNLVDSKIANNTGRTHDIAETVAKIAEDKGIVFNFTNNQKLRESGKMDAVADGVTINGYKDADGITVNIDSPNMLKTVVGHELTHVLEGTAEYTELAAAAKEYAVAKGEYDSRRESIASLYAEGTDIDSELTADMVGEYLFTDEQFVEDLSVKHRNVFQKVFDEIKHLVKMVTAGSKEARQLEQVKRTFERAYRAAQETQGDAVQNSLVGVNEDGIEVYETSKEVKKLPWKQKAAKYLETVRKTYRGKTIKFERNGHVYYAEFDRKHADKAIYGDSRSTKDGVNALVNAGADGDVYSILENSQYDGSKVNTKDHTKADYFDYYLKTVKIDGKLYDIIADIEKNYHKDGGYVYTLALRDHKKTEASSAETEREMRDPFSADNASVDTIISQNDGKVNRQFSLVGENANIDKSQLAVAKQMEADGKTADEIYTETGWYKQSDGKWRTEIPDEIMIPQNFDRTGLQTAKDAEADKYLEKAKKSLDDGNIDEETYAELVKFAEGVRDKEYNSGKLPVFLDAPKLYEAYPQLKNVTVFFKKLSGMQGYADAGLNQIVLDPDGLRDAGQTVREGLSHEIQHIIQSIEGFAHGSTPEAAGSYEAYRKAGGEIEARDVESRLRMSPEERRSYMPEQFSLSADTQGRELSAGQREYFKDSKVVDDNGNLKVMYHGTPNGDFTVFRDGTYFTDNKAYADKYQQPGASSLSVKKNASNPKTFEVYLDIKKPFDLSDPEAREIYINDYIKGGNAIGINPYLSDAEYDKITSIDWTEGEDLREFLQDNEYDYDGLILDEGGTGGYGDAVEYRGNSYVVFSPEQVKNVDNLNPTADPDIRRSLSDASHVSTKRGIYGRDIRYEGEEMQEAAPVRQTAEAVPQMQQDEPVMADAEPVAEDIAPIPGEHSEIDRLNAEYEAARAEFDEISARAQETYSELTPEEQEQAMEAVLAAGERMKAAQDALNAAQQDGLASYTDADVPPEVEAPYYGEEDPLPMPADPLADRDEKEVGARSVMAYQYLNPEVKPYFQAEANAMLGDLRRATRGERFVNWDTGGMGSDGIWTGQPRVMSYDLAGLKDRFGYSYEQLQKGIQAIIDDDGKENNAVSKRIELLIHDRLAHGYVDAYSGAEIPADQEYLDFLREREISEYNDEAFAALMADADSYVPPIAEDMAAEVAPVAGRVREAAFSVDAPVAESVEDVGGDTIAAEIPQEDVAADDGRIRTVRERLEVKLGNFQTELENNKQLRTEAAAEYDRQIAELETAYEALPNKATKKANAMQRRIERLVRFKGNNDADYAKRISDLEERVAKVTAEIKSGESPTEQANMRRDLHANIVENIRNAYEVSGYDMDDVFKGAKNLTTFSTVDNTPQRVMEKALGYKQGQILADMTVNKTAQHETDGIRWLNQYTDPKNGLIAQISRQYHIKPGSKESAAAQMYAEGFYVSKHDEIIKYGDQELAADFPDAKDQANIKGLARDPRIRAIYDETLDAINASRVRNAYPAIQKLDNYFLHFRAMEDTFSRIGLPFNPNDIRAMDLPTDLNGVTADLKPGQPYFASAQHRQGKRTSFDLLGGLEKYLSSAKNQIYHIDDIQTLRALRNEIVDTYGRSKGLQSLDELTEEEVQERIKEVFGSHLSTFASFLNEEANHIAGKKALIDRGLEGMLGRRALTFMSDLNRQVGANMVGYNISSSLTNLLAPVQAFAKMNKSAFVRGFAQTVSNRVGGIFGRGDNFAQDSSVMVRREGEKRFHRTAWQKMSDPGYLLMGAIDSISTEIIARGKYNELTGKGMSSEQAHYEADKWVSRLMGDRSLGQQPLLFNSKTLGLITKFQLEVRNQLDSQFYDTVKEAEVATANMENAAKRNAVKAAKITSTVLQLSVAQHLFGKAFEAIAGYNPAFDIIEAIIKAAGWDDDEEDDDTVLDNIEQGVLSLLEDLPYSSVLTGGRVPIESALPIAQFVKGKDSYGNDKSRLETLAEAAPYYLLPGGYGQIKKTAAGLGMYSDDHPVAGSYTDSGNMRFPVGTDPLDVAQAAVFGQYSSANARDYFDNERKPLSPKQVDEYAKADMTIQDYWRYRDGLAEHDKLADQADYINSLDIPTWKKNLFINNLTDRKEAIDMADYGRYGSLEEMDFAKKSPEKYKLLQDEGVTYQQYTSFDDKTKNAYEWAAKSPEKYSFIRDIGYTLDDYARATDKEKDAFTWAYNNPDKYLVSRAVSDDLFAYRSYTDDLNDIKADKDADGKSISGSRKDKVVDYINGLDLDYGAKIILLKSEYPSEDSYNYDIIDYLNEREDISGDDMIVMLTALGFRVSDDGTVTWD